MQGRQDKRPGEPAEGQVMGQISLFEFLADNFNVLPADEVRIEDVVNVETAGMSDFSVKSTYRDIFLIINMLDDYVRMLVQLKEEKDFYTGYMISQFERISKELSEQIGLDKEKMYKKCRNRAEKPDSIGEDAMNLMVKGK